MESMRHERMKECDDVSAAEPAAHGTGRVGCIGSRDGRETIKEWMVAKACQGQKRYELDPGKRAPENANG
jgi:hypothetical protein